MNAWIFFFLTIYFEGIDGLEFPGSHFAEDREHVHKFIEAEIPHPVLGERLHDPVAERIFLQMNVCVNVRFTVM